MPYKADLEIDGERYTVLECSYHLERDFDEFGKPTSIPRGGTMEIMVETTGTTLFVSWMMTQKHRKSGKIIFEDPTEDADIKVVEFEEAYMVNYRETFGSKGSTGMVEEFKISAKKIVVGDAEHDNNWYK